MFSLFFYALLLFATFSCSPQGEQVVPPRSPRATTNDCGDLRHVGEAGLAAATGG